MAVEYWSWIVGATALGSVAVGHYVFARAPFGVSSVYAKLINFRAEREAAIADAASSGLSDDDVQAALEEQMNEMLADAEAMGFSAEEMAELLGAPSVEVESTAHEVDQATAPVAATRVDPAAWITFMAALAIGGLGASLSTGRDLTLQFTPHPEIGAFLGGGVGVALLVLPVAGVMVGLGARMMGGCTMGHGLTGCGSMQRGSLLSTATFFGTAIVVSLLLEGITP